MSQPVYIIDASRTPFLKAQSKLGPGLFSASELAVQTGKSLLMRQKIKVDTKLIVNCDHHISVEASSVGLNYIKKNLTI